jgi:hypothetical protein
MLSSPTSAEGQIFIGPGLSLFKRYVTTFGVIAVTGLVLWIAYYQGVPVIGSTIAAVLFILGFVYYLRLVAPVPFTITIGSGTIVKRSSKGEVIETSWDDVTRIKEEFFPNGKRISITLYRKVSEPRQKAKVWAVYRDDVIDLDGLAGALQSAKPEQCKWQSETVHE